MDHPRSDLRTADVERAYTELSRITRRAGIRARGVENALSVVDHSLVDFIAEHPGCMAIDIARHLRLNRSTISRQLAGLLGAGLVETLDGGTGNAKPLQATDAGRAALDETVRLHRAGLEQRLADWSDDDVALLAGLLERLGAADESGMPAVPVLTDPGTADAGAAGPVVTDPGTADAGAAGPELTDQGDAGPDPAPGVPPTSVPTS